MALPQFRLKRNGTVILTWTPPSPSATSTPTGTVVYTPSSAAIRTLLDTPGGAATYRLEANGDVSTSVYYRALLVQGVMR